MYRVRLLLGPVLIGLFVASLGAQQADLLIRNVRLLDGTGNPWVLRDVAVRDGRILEVGKLIDTPASRTIDGNGHYLAPGFIDVHSHAAPGLATPGLSSGTPLLAQGITTVVANPDGGGIVDLKAQTAALEVDGLGVNVALMVPHGSIRAQVMGREDRQPSARQMAEMKKLVRVGMEDGGFGLSSGLFYVPGTFAETSEVIELARVAAAFGGVYASHIRDEADYTVGVVAAVEEVIRIAREAAIPGVVTHIKALGPNVWGASEQIIRKVERAREEGVQVFADQYPYEASATGIVASLVPRWAQAGGRSALLERLLDPAQAERIRLGMIQNLARRGGAQSLQFRFVPRNPSIEGKTLADLAAEQEREPVSVALDLVQQGSAGVVSFNMDARDVESLMSQPWVMTSSDGGLVPMGRGVPHPRNYGTFPRKIRTYVLEKRTVPLEDAIRSMTSLPASVFGFQERGLIRSGLIADLVLFDLDRIHDTATFSLPHQLAEGVELVVVNGKVALESGTVTAGRYGQVLRKR